jgi:hypothetical protein
MNQDFNRKGEVQCRDHDWLKPVTVKGYCFALGYELTVGC